MPDYCIYMYFTCSTYSDKNTKKKVISASEAKAHKGSLYDGARAGVS